MQPENPYIQYMYSYPHKTAYRSLKDVHLKDYLNRLSGTDNHLYFHIPFCQYKCGYCNLFSVTGRSEQWMNQYVEVMKQHAKQLADILPADIRFESLTLGGGTPLILPEESLRNVFSLARNELRFEPEQFPIIIETSPNQTTIQKLKLLKEEHVNRISIGVQSFQENELSTLHRFHNVSTAQKALDTIKQMHFDCMNIDLIYGIPGQTTETLLDSLTQALAFEPEELFVYPLYIKPGTTLYSEHCKRSEQIYTMQKQVREFLINAGYQPHSMRRFVKKTCDNIGQPTATLCGFENTLSIGCGGRSYIGNLHFCNPYAVKQKHCLSILEEYMAREDFLQISHGIFLSPEEEKRRYVIKHIFFGTGIQLEDYQLHFQNDVLKDFPLLKEWIDSGYATIDTNFITLTELGFSLSDYLGPMLISEEVAQKTKEFYQSEERLF